MKDFTTPYNYKVIYILEIDSVKHKGLIKIGDTSIESKESIDKLFPNSSSLNKVAHERIKQYTNTAGISYKLLHTEIAIAVKDNKLKAFTDKDVHKLLNNSGIKNVKIDNTTGQEWFRLDVETGIKAIRAIKEGKVAFDNTELISSNSSIIFRPEQEDAIARTIKNFKKNNKMLWNAKMRFGKTLTTLQVIKEMNFKKSIIITHRPVVNEGWNEDFRKIFYNTDEFMYGSKANGFTISKLEETYKNFVYFASIQDLRGSEQHNKNEEIFNLEWDFVVVDEAHEGTTTALGNQVIQSLINENTKFLALSGTPFNIVSEYKEDELYTWDYVMEQKAKNQWSEVCFGDSNPYDSLPKLNIYTYNLGKELNNYNDLEDKAFNFREFFRTKEDNTQEFIHKKDVNSFLNLITQESANSNYPYANDEYRNLFKHSLWIVPGVKEAKALSELLNKHSVFGNGQYDVINVAGSDEEEAKNALVSVKEGIEKASKNGINTITISCGKLTTGVTIPEWTAVMMLSGSFSTSASSYLQTIFRVQSPANIDGKIKENCYVFDFAPDRTLKMVADAVNLSSKAGKTSISDRKAMGEFLNFCPVISIDGTEMRKFNENHLLQELKKAYAERAVKNGFDDTSIYNDIELSKLTEGDLEKFMELKKIVGASKANKKTENIDINNIGLTDEQYEELEEAKSKPAKSRTQEEQERLDKLKELQSNRTKAISNLRALSIRIPLLIYGANVEFDEDITAERLVDIVDQSSWEEFMPTNMTKVMFKSFIKYYDADVFISAGRHIKNIVKQADSLPPTERVKKITELFGNFKNPDKETVLTPWRVVNMHINDCLGGYNFYDETYETMLDEPRLVIKDEVTEATLLKRDTKILEINSKTGLYPLYVTYSIFRSKLKEGMSIEEQNTLWKEVVAENIFIICKTPMAKAITQRTLLGFREGKVNSHYFENLTGMLRDKPTKFVEKVSKPNYWSMKGSGKVKFDAIVGNPPYQISDGGGIGTSALPVYNNFVNIGRNLEPEYLSMVIPARWFSGGRGLENFRISMLEDKKIQVIHDFLESNQLFTDVEIKGGVCYFLWNRKYSGDCDIYSHKKNCDTSYNQRPLLEDGMVTFIRNNEMISMLRKIKNKNEVSLSSIISANDPFGFDVREKNSYKRVKPTYSTTKKENSIAFYYNGWRKQGVGYVDSANVRKGDELINKPKVFIPKAWGTGNPETDWLNPFIPDIKSCCTETYLVVGSFKTLEEAGNFIKYTQTKFFHALVSVLKITQNTMQSAYLFVPIQDFTSLSDINWNMPTEEIENQLYKKYAFAESEIEFIKNTIKSKE